MSRNKKQTHGKIFNKLCEKAKESDRYQESIAQSRWLKTDGQKNSDCIIYSKIDYTFPISHHVICSLIAFREEKYFVISGVSIDDSIYDFEMFKEPSEDIFDGLVTVVLAELPIPLNNEFSSDEIALNILSDSKELLDDYKGHLTTDIQKCFVPFTMFDITDSRFSIYQIAGIMLCKQTTKLLPFDEITIEKFEDIFNINNNSLPFENLVYALYSVSWKHSFLETYRGIENLYPVFAIKDASKNLYDNLIENGLNENQINLFNFYRLIIENLGYKEKEMDTLNKIICFTGLNDIFDGNVKEKLGLSTKDHEIIYKVRCAIVHFSIFKKEVDFNKLDDSDWNNLIKGMLQIIESMYKII